MANLPVGGISQHYYHTVPSTLDLITTNPTREAIAKYLAQIPYKKFPEFISDILQKVLNHTSIEITDGPGDEGMDILSLNPLGEKCLTQCKHSVDPTSNYHGQEIDYMVLTCMRKNCKNAIFATNGDLTPQAKKYINDEEYSRLLESTGLGALKFGIDYLNGYKIWDLIKDNADIVNKWFSKMGQTNGMRNFRFDVTIQPLPYDKSFQSINPWEKVIDLLLKNGKIVLADTKSDSYNATISDKISIYIEKWFQFTAELDINYMLPDDEIDFLHKPMYSLTIEASVFGGKFQPEAIRDEIIFALFNTLPGFDGTQWWHITCSPSKTFTFLHDIGQPREIKLASARTFVKALKLPILGEFEYCSLNPQEFELLVDGDDIDDESIWQHKTSGFKIFQSFNQKVNPIKAYNHHLIQLQQSEKFKTYSFYAVDKIDFSMGLRLRKYLPPEWVALIQDNDAIIWGIPPETEQKVYEQVHNRMKAIGANVLQVRDEDRGKIIDSIARDIPPAAFWYISDLKDISFPVDLKDRMFTVMASLNHGKIPIPVALSLTKYKYTLEQRFGFDNMGGQETLNSHTTELPGILSDFFSIRGEIMLDLNIQRNPMPIFLRFRNGSIAPSNQLALEYIDTARKIVSDIQKLLNGESFDTIEFIS